MKLRLAVLVLAALATVPVHPGSGSANPLPVAEPAADPAAGAAGRTAAELEEELDEFVPSEGLPADSSISFPVDI